MNHSGPKGHFTYAKPKMTIDNDDLVNNLVYKFGY